MSKLRSPICLVLGIQYPVNVVWLLWRSAGQWDYSLPFYIVNTGSSAWQPLAILACRHALTWLLRGKRSTNTNSVQLTGKIAKIKTQIERAAIAAKNLTCKCRSAQGQDGRSRSASVCGVQCRDEATLELTRVIADQVMRARPPATRGYPRYLWALYLHSQENRMD